jgi:hypothetical protein
MSHGNATSSIILHLPAEQLAWWIESLKPHWSRRSALLFSRDLCLILYVAPMQLTSTLTGNTDAAAP